MSRRFAEFTEKGYASLIRTVREGYRFEPFGTRESRPHVLWRHDVDLSVHRALRLAEIERGEEVSSTFFFLLHSEFYNLLERGIMSRVRKIAALGHHIGLHFDSSFYQNGPGLRAIERRLAGERRLLEDVVGKRVRAFSLHDPKPAIVRLLSLDRIAGMINVYGPAIRTQYEYCSDSNGYWRHSAPADLVAPARHQRLHVLTHPEWWVPVAMSPWRRMQRCVSGRAEFVVRFYNRALARDRRHNVGAPR